MQNMIKSVFAVVAAMFIGASVQAADNDKMVEVSMGLNEVTNVCSLVQLAIPRDGFNSGDYLLWAAGSTTDKPGEGDIVDAEWTDSADGVNKDITITSKGTGTSTVVLRRLSDDAEFTFNLYVAKIEVEKTVKQSDNSSNATIRIVSHVDCGATVRNNRILFVGSLCGKHELEKVTVKDAVAALVERADVDWYFFNNDYETDYDNTVAYKAGHYHKGDTVDYGAGENQLPDFRGNDKDGPTAHCNLKAYLSLVTNALDIASAAYKQYDYIVFEFDSYRLAEKYNSGNANWDELEKTAARCLKKFYDQNRVLWIVDKGKSGEDPLVGNKSKWYTPSSYRRTDTKYGGKMSDRQWMGVLALLDPGTYMTNNVPYVYEEGGYKYANRIESQVNYEQSEEVKKAIADHMVLPTYDAQVEDNVITVGGLVALSNGVESVKVYQWNGAEAPVQDKDAGQWYADGTEWGLMTDSACEVAVNPEDNGIKAVVSNLNGSVWCKLEIAISTKEGFNEKAIEEAEKAERDPEYKKTAWCVKSDGQYRINPNKGDAQLTLFRSRSGKTELTCAAQTASLSQWWLVELAQDFLVDSTGAYRVYDGIATNILVAVTNADEKVKTAVIEYRKVGDEEWTNYEGATSGFTDVVKTKVEFRISGVDGYVDYYGTNTVEIAPRPVSFGFAAKDKVYDGKTAAETTQNTYTVPTGVTGESIVFDVSEMEFYFDTPNVGDNTVTGEWYSAEFVTVKKGAGAKNPTTDRDVLKGNYELNFIPTAPAKILPRALTNENAIVANDQTMTYGDVPPVLAGEYTGGDNLADDEKLYVELIYTNTAWDVREYPDAISTNDLAKAIIISNGTEDVTANYTIEFKPGTLTVEPKDGRDPKVKVAAVTDTFYYNDYGYQPKPEVTDTAFDPVKTLEEGVDFDYDWLNNTNASKEAKVIVNFKGNYKNSVTNDFEILKRTVTLTSGSDKWTYDGEAHGTNGVTATAYGATAGQEDKTDGQGFVPGEGVTTNGFPTITTVGTKKNDFAYDPILPQTLADNYTVNAVTGTLEVVVAPIEPKTPEESRTPPEDPTPDNPGDQTPPAAGAGPTLWAPDIAKYYDGKGTNTEAKVFGVDPAYAFAYEYTTNVNHEADEVWSKTLQFTNVLFGVSGEVTSYKVYCRAKDEAGNYVGTNYVAYVTILPKPLGPEPDPDILIPPLPDVTYSGDAFEPEVVVTNKTTGLVLGEDYTVEYVSNTNATEEAFAIIRGQGNYGGVYTNAFRILPRTVTIRSGTTEVYLPEAGGSAIATNALTWIVDGSFVTNAVTGVEDGYVADVTGYLENSVPDGPSNNWFTVEATAFATNYNFVLQYGELVIKMAPTNHEDIVEDVPGSNGVVTIKMNNTNAGRWATTMPPELRNVATNIACVAGETNVVELTIEDTNHWTAVNWEHYVAVTGEIVKAGADRGDLVGNYHYDALDITLETMKWKYETPEDVTTNDIGHVNEDMQTIPIPFEFKPGLLRLEVWRNHSWTNEDGQTQTKIERLGMDEPLPEATEYFTTNAMEIVLHAKKFSEYVIMTCYAQTPLLRADIRWTYCAATDCFFGQLCVACTNGLASNIESVRYLFQDRGIEGKPGDSVYLYDWTNNEKVAKTVTYGETEFRCVEVDDEFMDSITNAVLGTDVIFGITQADWDKYASRNIVPGASRKLALWATSRPDFLDAVTNDLTVAQYLTQSLGYYVWTVKGEPGEYWQPLGSDVENLKVLGDPIMPDTVSNTRSMSPPSVTAVNRSLAMGVPVADGSSSDLRVAEFSVDSDEISGRVESVAGGQVGVPGINAKMTLLGRPDLSVRDEETWPIQLDGAGRFKLAKPKRARFFRVKLEVLNIVK